MKTPDSGDFKWDATPNALQWQGTIELPSLIDVWMQWNDVGCKVTDRRNDANLSDRRGEFSVLAFAPESAASDPQLQAAGLSIEQQAAYRNTVENESAICQVVLETIAAYFSAEWADYYSEDGASDDLIQHVSTSAGIGQTLNLNSIFIHNTTNGGIAKVGFGFDCSWESEHGVGVLLHRSEVLKVGGEDEAFIRQTS